MSEDKMALEDTEVEDIEVEVPQVEETPTEELQIEEPITDEDLQPTIDAYTYELKRKKYQTLEELAEAGGCPPNEHNWKPGFSFGAELCRECRAVRRKRK